MLRKAYYSILVILSLVGVWATFTRLSEGLKVSGLTTYSSWGMWVVFYIFFIGLSAGSFLLSTMVYVFNMKQFEKIGKVALLSAFFSLMAGLVFILIDLGHPARFWHTLVYRQANSVLSWEIQLYLLYLLLIVAELWLLLREQLSKLAKATEGFKSIFYKTLALGYSIPNEQKVLEEQRAKGAKWLKTLGIIGIPTAIGVHGGTGSIFGVVAAKHYWNSGLTPIIFLVSALVSGAALMLLIYAFMGPDNQEKKSLLNQLSSLLILFISVDLLLVASEFLVGLYSTIPDAKEPLLNIAAGPQWYIFWLGQIGLGAVVPILLLVNKNKTALTSGLAGISVIIGIVAVRWNLIIPAYTSPHLEGLNNAYIDPRLVYEYIPSSIEWLSSIGLIGLFMLAFSAACILLPVFKNEEVELDHERQSKGLSTSF
ncbi:MAG: hypothetical protein JM58_05105 [Peptococcaceae bacterium BICA1-8]|nr:MAG: hypothetical protein JM58_05105 [Peptococcaceae bacterium BICA1-8]